MPEGEPFFLPGARDPVAMNDDLKTAVLNRCREMEIPLVGVASTVRWENPPFLPWMTE